MTSVLFVHLIGRLMPWTFKVYFKQKKKETQITTYEIRVHFFPTLYLFL